MTLRRALKTLALPAALVAGALPALATPPDTVRLQDELFGVSADKVYLLRTVLDNYGSYTITVRNIALVTVDRKDGTEDIRSVERATHVTDLESDPTGNLWTVARRKPGDAVNPHDVLAEAEGLPLFTLFESEDIAPLTIEDPAADTLTIKAGEDRVYSTTRDELWQRASAAFASFGDSMGDYQRMGPLTLADLLEENFLTPEDCQVTRALQLLDRLAEEPVVLLAMQCGNPEEDSLLASIYVVLPPPAPEEAAPEETAAEEAASAEGAADAAAAEPADDGAAAPEGQPQPADG